MTIVVPAPTSRLAFAIAPFIFLPVGHYYHYARGTMSLEEQSVLVHEQVHIDRERAQGIIDYGWQYYYDAEFRLNEELLAIAEQMKFLKARGGTYNIERKAEHFAGAIYGHMLPYNDALERLQVLWDEAVY